MQFEWDEGKNRANIAKHGISFEQARLIFYDLTVDLVDDRADYGETRIISLGLLEGVVVLSVAHTDREGRIRLISARRASRKERAVYHGTVSKASER
ncbi:MAG: BrnT family toxin [Sedimentitalea sp.]|uniref:BrnT family toxin n=1 Tax=Sedimentitalea sp. TaxID=2048915 RepID=UPI00326495DA